MKVTLIIPTMNEGESIEKVLKEIPRKLINEIIVVDGNSTDNTKKKAIPLLRKNKDKFVTQKKKGFGNALMQAFDESRGDVLIIMNGDGSHNPTDIKKLLDKIKKGSEYVIASRYAKGAGSDDDTIIRYIGNRILTKLTNIIHGTNVSDSLHFFTAITKKGIKKLHLTSPGFEFCIEILIKAHKAGLKFAEVPVIERARYAGESKVNAFSAGWKILKTIILLKI
jgi:glycosyltransferase involved in cell wall biosynthesis